MKASVDIVNVTPKMAQDWLENVFDGQRNVRDGHVARLATDIMEGRWKLSCDAITLIKGKLGNGQHRCWAIFNSGRTCPCLVLRTDDDGLFDIIDSGVPRTTADVLHQYAFAHASAIAAAARVIVSYQKGMITRLGLNHSKKVGDEHVSVVTRGEILDFCRDNQEEMAEYAKLAGSLYAQKGILQKSYAIAFLWLASKKNKEKAIEFITDVFLGGKQSSAFDLRERLLKNRISKAKLPQPFIFGITIKAFAAFLAGKRTACLKFIEGEEFPKIP